MSNIWSHNFLFSSNTQQSKGQTCLYTSEQWPIACPYTTSACNPNGLVRTNTSRHNLQNHSYKPIWRCWWGRFCWWWTFRKCHQQLRSKLGRHWSFSSFLKTINMNPLATEFYAIKIRCNKMQQHWRPKEMENMSPLIREFGLCNVG